MVETVLKCRLCYGLGMAKLQEQVTDATEETYSVILSDPERKGLFTSRGAYEEASGSLKRQREQGGNVGKIPCCGFHGKEQVRQGKVAEDWLV